MARSTVVYDACVLYPAPLRDLLMSLAVQGLFQARWTEQIHAEWMRNLLRNEPHRAPQLLERTRDRMNGAVRDCLIEGYEPLIETLSLPDPNDRHVLAAAIHGRAEVIVTFNLRDFPIATLALYGLRAQHPDTFVSHWLDAEPETVCRAIREQRARLKSPPQTVDELLQTFQNQKLSQTALRLRAFADTL